MLLLDVRHLAPQRRKATSLLGHSRGGGEVAICFPSTDRTLSLYEDVSFMLGAVGGLSSICASEHVLRVARYERGSASLHDFLLEAGNSSWFNNPSGLAVTY